MQRNKNPKKHKNVGKKVAPQAGLEPATHWLTVNCSTNWAIAEYSLLKVVPINTKILGATTVILADTEVFSKPYNYLDMQANLLANLQAKKRELESSRRC